jgi:hypothetical protein
MLHSDDIGKWGKHIWPLLLEALGNEGKKGHLTVKYNACSYIPVAQIELK